MRCMMVKRLVQALKPAGLCSIMSYVGHEEGSREYAMLNQLLAELPPQQWITAESSLLNRPSSPRLLMVWRRPLADGRDANCA
jgi:Putative rRNA methylase